MSNLKRYYYKLKNTPPHKILKQVFYRATQKLKEEIQKKHDCIIDSRKKDVQFLGSAHPIEIKPDELDLNGVDEQVAQELWRMYKAHRFDLLGSGWVKNTFLNNAPGVEGYRYDSIELNTDANGDFLYRLMRKKNAKKSQEIWKLISGNYNGIDWQKDYKSGYRWGAFQWYRPQENAKELGGDIKVPWELSRLQHHPRMAIIAMKLPEERDEIFTEYCNQTLDFIAQNPPRWGVNYMCTMDVGIRTANMALAYSLFKSIDIEFDHKVEHEILKFIYEQCDFIYNNLEWTEGYTSNHYFGDIAGLLYGSAILPDCDMRLKWIQFAKQQIDNEIIKQFYEEGTNKEGSVAYHRLTAEMAIYSASLVQYLCRRGECGSLSEEAWNRIIRGAVFLKDVTTPAGCFTQFGDNDSGLFFRLSLTGKMLLAKEAIEKYVNLKGYTPESEEELYYDENLNDGRTYISAVQGALEEDLFLDEKDRYPLEASLVYAIMREKKSCNSVKDLETVEEFEDCGKPSHSYKQKISSEDNLLDGIYCRSYPQFGVYIYRSNNLYLCINATDNGQMGGGGHAHNDKLSFELYIGGKPIYQDPGTYVYTAFPEMRNQYRSTIVHNTIYVGQEQNNFLSLFAMQNETHCRCVEYTDKSIELEVNYKDVIHRRRFMIEENHVIVEDSCSFEFCNPKKNVNMTVGYGKMLKTRV